MTMASEPFDGDREIGEQINITVGGHPGYIVYRGNGSFEAFNDNNASLGRFADEDDAGWAIFECGEKLQTNGGNPHAIADEEPSQQPEPAQENEKDDDQWFAAPENLRKEAGNGGDPFATVDEESDFDWAAPTTAKAAAVHICAQCQLNPPDGSERLSAYNDEWLHPHCEEAFIHARMAEESVPWEAQVAEPLGADRSTNADGSQAKRNGAGVPKFDHATALEFYKTTQPGVVCILGFKHGIRVASVEQFQALAQEADNRHEHLFFHVATVSPTWASGTTATKEQIPECPYLWGDCDARKYAGSDPAEAAKHYADEGARISQTIDDGLRRLGITAYAKWRSGAGWQFRIKLDRAITPDEAEELVCKLHVVLGFDPVVRNCNRILRVPGSINWKNGKDGRVPSECLPLCLSNTVTNIDDVRNALANVAMPAAKVKGNSAATESDKIDWAKVREPGWLTSVEDLPGDISDKLRSIVGHTGTLDALNNQLTEGGFLDKPYETWSDVTLAITSLLKFYAKYTPEEIAEALLADLPCNQHITGQKNKKRAVERAITRSHGPETVKLPLIAELGSKLWGPATQIGKEYRFGTDQSKVIDPIKGNWFDFATNRGGSIRELMKKVATTNRTNDAVVVGAANIKMRSLDWLWPEHLLRGSQELLSGLPDLGKSQVQISYVACATAGLLWPNGAPPIEPVNTIMMTAEDTLDQLVVPRLRAAGADLNRVRFLKCIKTDEHDRQFLLAEDLHQLEHVITEFGNVGLVTIDPITAYMGSKMDSHKATEVRSQLGPLKDLAERLNIVVSTLTHPPKSAGQRALDHFIGSQAFIAACRIGHLCIAETEENAEGERIPTGRILFTTVRNSAGRLKQTLAFHKEQVDEVGREERGLESRVITAARVVWEGIVDITADAAVAAASSKKSDLQPKVQAFLRELLKDGKPVPQKEIDEAAAKKGFTEKQLRTAREKLSVDVSKEPGKMDGKWLWQLPDPDDGKYYY